MHTNGMKGEKTYLLQAPEDLKYIITGYTVLQLEVQYRST